METKKNKAQIISSNLTLFSIPIWTFLRILFIGGVILGIHRVFDFKLFEASIVGLGACLVFKAFDINQTLRKELTVIQEKIEGMSFFYEPDEEDLGIAFRNHLEGLLSKNKADAVRLYRNVSQCDMQSARQFINDLENTMTVEKNVK